jgi:hypothetical protein
MEDVMKRIIANAGSLMVVFLSLAGAGYAQQAIKATVPFEFSVGKNTFPAGEYRVVRVGATILQVEGSRNQPSIFVLTAPLTSIKTFSPKLKFKVENGQHVLSQVWSDGATGYQLFVPKQRLTVAQNSPESQTTTASFTGK